MNVDSKQENNNLNIEEKKFYRDLGTAIRSYRRLKDFSQEYMAVKLRMSQNAYSKIETGKCKCSAYNLTRIMNLLTHDFQNPIVAAKNKGII